MAEFYLMCCGECGIEFQVPTHFQSERKKTGKSWFCPNGHSRVYSESDADKFRRERDNALQQVARAQDDARDANRRADAAIKEKKRIEKRIHAGVCTCCNRTFVNLQRHMATKHADNVVPIKKAAS